MRKAGAVVKESVEVETLQEMLDFDPGSVQSKSPLFAPLSATLTIHRP